MNAVIRLLLSALPAIAAASGCTHVQLRDSTIRTAGTVADLQYQQVLDNIARFSVNPAVLPYFAVPSGGTVTVTDGVQGNAGTTWNPTLTRPQQIAATIPLLDIVFGIQANRTLTENWSLAPVNDGDKLRRMQCAYQLLVGAPGMPRDACVRQLEEFFLGEPGAFDRIVPQGWYAVGRKPEVPMDALYVGHFRETYVWVTNDGMTGLTNFTLAILELATAEPHAPMRKVVRTYRGKESVDGLQTTEVTTTEPDASAIEKMRKDPSYVPPRVHSSAKESERGLFFIPR